jgi:endo-alpha-1,4-polygalactosaminidase (GH114 family)
LGPKMSQLINSKGITKEIELTEKGRRLCLARAQTSQALLDWKEKLSKCFTIKSNLEEDKCLTEKGRRLCLARAQKSQALLDWKEKLSKCFAIKYNLEEDKCPKRRCHKAVEEAT